MRSFLTILGSVLREDEDVPELPTEKLVAVVRDNVGATALGYTVPVNIMIKLARLQTLKIREGELSSMPEMDVINQQASETKTSSIEVMARSLSIQEDSTRREMMIERLIVELVRETYPQECNVSMSSISFTPLME
jgi:hypothetical protein